MLQTFLSDGRMREFLTQARTIAVVGAKDKEGQPVDRVGKYLIQAGYQVIPVHPIRKDVWSLQTYPSLAEVPFPVDIVNVFRAPQYCPDHARETVAPLPPAPTVLDAARHREPRSRFYRWEGRDRRR